MPRPTGPFRPSLSRAVSLGLGLVLISVGTALGHAVVYPAEAPPGAYQKYVLRVPNERAFPTTRVEITFPTGVRVISFDEVPGWTLDTTSEDAGASYARAVWTGVLAVGLGRSIGQATGAAQPAARPTARAALGWAVMTGVMIASYSIIDKVGAGSIDPLPYTVGLALGGVALVALGFGGVLVAERRGWLGGAAAPGVQACTHGLAPAACPFCEPALVERLGRCGEHGVPDGW